jgi:hypothetical protein
MPLAPGRSDSSLAKVTSDPSALISGRMLPTVEGLSAWVIAVIVPVCVSYRKILDTS